MYYSLDDDIIKCISDKFTLEGERDGNVQYYSGQFWWAKQLSLILVLAWLEWFECIVYKKKFKLAIFTQIANYIKNLAKVSHYTVLYSNTLLSMFLLLCVPLLYLTHNCLVEVSGHIQTWTCMVLDLWIWLRMHDKRPHYPAIKTQKTI